MMCVVESYNNHAQNNRQRLSWMQYQPSRLR